MTHRRSFGFIVSACGFLFAGIGMAPLAVAADRAASAPINYETRAQPIDRTKPRYPFRARQSGLEGWVQFNYTVEADGTLSNVEILSASPKRTFEKEALRAFQKWSFKPATIDGVPVRSCNNEAMFRFAMGKSDGSGQRIGAERRFIKKYKKVQQLIRERSFEEALTVTDEMLETDGLNLYELANLHNVRGVIFGALGRTEEASSALKKATTFDGKYLNKKVVAGVFDDLFVHQVGLQDYQSALETYEKRLELDKGEPSPAIVKVAEQLRALKEADTPFSVVGNLEPYKTDDAKNGSWYFNLLRREIGLIPVKGKPERLRIACDKNSAEMDFNADQTWKVPESWGDCKVFVYGAPGAEFQLVQY